MATTRAQGDVADRWLRALGAARRPRRQCRQQPACQRAPLRRLRRLFGRGQCAAACRAAQRARRARRPCRARHRDSRKTRCSWRRSTTRRPTPSRSTTPIIRAGTMPRTWLRRRAAGSQAAGGLARAERALRLPRAETQRAHCRGAPATGPSCAPNGRSPAARPSSPRRGSARPAATSPGRAFLHDYDWRHDEGFGVLELIMTAPVVVASWISLQYYGSTVAPEALRRRQQAPAQRHRRHRRRRRQWRPPARAGCPGSPSMTASGSSMNRCGSPS